jgi:GDP-4-dehydro-6-deoxy-D-mannose reductase
VRVLITGIEGFVGGHLGRRLAEEGHEVWGTSLHEPPGEEPRWLRCDVRRGEEVRQALARSAAEAVIHLAARSFVPESHADPLSTFEVNVVGTLNVLEAVRRAGLVGPVLLIGTSEIYGGSNAGESAGGGGGGARTNARLREDMPVRPVSPYGSSKAAAELLGAQYARSYGLRVVLTRSFAHTGPGQDPRFVFPSFARQLVEIQRAGGRGAIRVGNLAPVRDVLDVRDVVRAYALLLDRADGGAILNVCSGQGFSIGEYLDELIEIAGVDVEIVPDAERIRKVESDRLVGDPGKLFALGWEPAVSKHEMLTDLLSYWRSQP